MPRQSFDSYMSSLRALVRSGKRLDDLERSVTALHARVDSLEETIRRTDPDMTLQVIEGVRHDLSDAMAELGRQTAPGRATD